MAGKPLQLFCLFLSTLSLRRATFVHAVRQHQLVNFYPRSPCGERLEHLSDCVCLCLISIHALLAESDHGLLHHMRQAKYFYPRSPCGERHRNIADAVQHIQISIHALLAESDRAESSKTALPVYISIHALLAESDTEPLFIPAGVYNFYPRSPCGERPVFAFGMPTSVSFLSTLSLRRATLAWSPPACTDMIFLSTLSLRRATLIVVLLCHHISISIHALLAESDVAQCIAVMHDAKFLSTLSLRRATYMVLIM